jgi:thiosulfate/3-mercaptopyruvate sulfurtransferase
MPRDMSRAKSWLRTLWPFFFVLLLIPIAIALPARNRPDGNGLSDEAWTSAQTVQPADLAAEFKSGKKPSLIVIQVGVRTLFLGAHIPGAVFHGPASSAEGLADLQNYAAKLPRNSGIVLYCGCCPLEHCPNIRPAFRLFQQMGFKNLRVLILPTSFAADWVEKGFPIQKGN